MTVIDYDAADPDLLDKERNTADLRGLVMSGGKPYILIVLEDPESGGVDISHAGFDEGLNLATALRELADLLDAQD